jgi:hypothetical protein
MSAINPTFLQFWSQFPHAGDDYMDAFGMSHRHLRHAMDYLGHLAVVRPTAIAPEESFKLSRNWRLVGFKPSRTRRFALSEQLPLG